MNTTFRVKEFADLAGVTVRTLQYYDRLGLLKPAGYRNGNHRVYQSDDLLRLQQILTFKYLGYGLKQIRQLLQSPEYDVVEALKCQRNAINERIGKLQKVVKSIDRATEALSKMDTADLDWKIVREAVAGIVASERFEWIGDYYTPKQKEMLKKRAGTLDPEQLVKWQKQWSDVLLGFQKVLDRKKGPEDPEAQHLAEKMEALVQGFTKGDKGIERSLSRAYGDLEKRSADERPFSPELQRFMSQACAIRRKGKQ
jgi:MerR family transcriptional regulator, thiopeptide resistance regulator